MALGGVDHMELNDPAGEAQSTLRRWLLAQARGGCR